jgi:hypothetical protein
MRTLRSLILAVLLGLIVLAITGFLAGLAYRSTDDGTLVDWFGAIGSALAIAVTATFGIDRLSQGRRDDDRRRQELGAAAFRLAEQSRTIRSKGALGMGVEPFWRACRTSMQARNSLQAGKWLARA